MISKAKSISSIRSETPLIIGTIDPIGIGGYEMKRTTFCITLCGLMLLQAIIILSPEWETVSGIDGTRSDPVLSNGGVTPTSGNPVDDVFDFYVTYSDSDGDWPYNLSVIIDGEPFGMWNYSSNGNQTEFIFHHYSSNFGSGTHQFYFEHSSWEYNQTIQRYPSSGTLSFSIVDGYNKPEILNCSISNNEPVVGEIVNFTAWYRDVDGDPPGYVVLVIEGYTSIMMTGHGSDYKNGTRYTAPCWIIPRSYIHRMLIPRVGTLGTHHLHSAYGTRIRMATTNDLTSSSRKGTRICHTGFTRAIPVPRR